MKKLLFIAVLAFLSCQKTTSKVSSNTVNLNSSYTFTQPCCGYSRRLNLTFNVDTSIGNSVLVLEDNIPLGHIKIKTTQYTTDFTDLYSCLNCITYYTFIFEYKDGTEEELAKFKTQ